MADPPGGRVRPSSGSTSSHSQPSFKKKGVAQVRETKKAQEEDFAPPNEPQETPGPIKKSRKEMETTMEKLITRLQRQFSSQRPSEQKFHFPQRPPDQAASGLGRELANAWVETLDYPPSDNTEFEAVRKRALQCLVNKGVHPSIPHAFFTELTSERCRPLLTSTPESSFEEWLPSFILDCEQKIVEELPNSTYDDYYDVNGLNETLAAAIKAYASFSAQTKDRDKTTIVSQSSHDLLTTTYRRMQSSAGRSILLREFPRSVRELSGVKNQLSPLMAACVLTAWSTPHNEKTLFLQELWRQCWDVIYATDDFNDFWDILFWMTEALTMFLIVLPSASRNAREHKPAWRELAQGWLMELADMLAFVVHATSSEEKSRKSSERLLAEWLQVVLNTIVPILSLQGSSSYRLSLEPLLEQLNGLIVEMDDSLLQLNTMVIFRLSTMAMATPLKGETRCILALFSYLLPSESAYARGLTSALGSIYMQDPTCHAAAKHLIKTAQGIDQPLVGVADNRSKTTNVVQLLEDGEDGYEVLEFIANVDAYALENLSAVKQVEALLLGISMLEIDGNTKLQKSAREFLKNLIRRYPHLGLSLLPGLLEDINASAVEKTPEELLGKLEFLCDSVVIDPSCAQQAWNLLGEQMLQPHNPLALRITIIRLLPRLCVTNKRLYRRVIDKLGALRDGKASSDPDALSPDSMKIQTAAMEIRLAVAASIADLAKDDLIRDPADCIGWIQEFLVSDYSDSAINALLVHYAILSLHYLVVSGELDFNMVLKVLKKKLCNIGNIDEVKKLPAIILESLTLLLGDGECKSGSSSEGEDEGEKVAEVSAQVIAAVQLLIDLGFQFEDAQPDEHISIEVIARIRRNIFRALTRYSLDCLGLDEDGIKAALEEGNAPAAASRYIALRHLAIEGLRIHGKQRDVVDDFDAVIEEFNLKMLRFEEEALGTNLWATKGTRHHTVQQRRGDSNKTITKDAISLPSPAKVQNLHKKNPSTVSSVAWLLCFEGKSVSKFLALAGDVSFQETDPLMGVFIIQAWLHACSRIVGDHYDGTRVKGLSSIVGEIHSWGDRTGNSDAVYLTLATILAYVPRSDDRDDHIIIDKIHNEIWSGFKGLLFLNNDMAKIVLALTAVSAIRFGSLAKVDEVIQALERSVNGYGGQMSFGACYGLAIISQAICEVGSTQSSHAAVALKSKISNLAGFLVRELLNCTEEMGETNHALTTFVACLQSGTTTPGLVTSLAESVSKQFSLISNKQQTARYLFICLGVCLPCLSQVNGDLLLGSLFLLEKFQWGSGKGIGLVPVLAEAKKAGVLMDEEYKVIIAEYARVFDQGLDSNSDLPKQQDIFYAVSGTNTQPSPHVTRQFLTQTSYLFDDDKSVSPLIGALASIGSFPCMGLGSKSFMASAQLRSDISKPAIESIVEIVAGALEMHADQLRPDYSRTAVAMLGLLTSMQKEPVDFARVASSSSSSKEKASSPSKLKTLNLDFGVLPSAQQGTLLFEILQLIQQAHKSAKYIDLIRYLRCMECLSLPGHFSKHFLEPLISENDDGIKEACVSLLSAQILGRRKAVFDGRDFANMALQISIMPFVSFCGLLGEGKAPLNFIKCLEGVVKSLPSELIESGTGNLWEICLSLATDSNELLIAFLKSFRTILRQQHEKDSKQNKLSPKTNNYLERFLCKRVFLDLREFTWATSREHLPASGEEALVETYIACLGALPIESLEKHDFFTYQEDDGFAGDILRSLVNLELVRVGYITEPARALRETSKVLAWFSRQLVAPVTEEYSDSLRRIACAIASTTLSMPERQNLLLSIFEQLLLCHSTAYQTGLDLLSVVVSSWCGEITTDGDLSMFFLCVRTAEKLNVLSSTALVQVFGLLRHDLPFNLATYGRLQKINALISNQVWRLISAWSKNEPNSEVLRCLKKTFICGSNGETKNEDFASLTSKMLLESDFFHSTLLR